MAFYIHSSDDGRNPPIEYLPCSAIAPKMGMALTVSGGNLALATGATAPSYISMREQEEACTAGDLIPVIRVGHDVIFETTNSVALTAKVGQKVTLATSGLEVTNTTDSGVAEIVSMDGTAAGSKVRVRF